MWYILILFVDGGEGAGCLEAAKFDSSLVHADLSRCGLILNIIKSNWEPANKFSWFVLPLTRTQVLFTRMIPILKIFSPILMAFVRNWNSQFLFMIGKSRQSLARSLCGNAAQITTRNFLIVINSTRSWKSVVFVSEQGKEEPQFWGSN